MYGNLIIVSCLIIVIFVTVKYRIVIHPLLIFNSIWLVIFILESLHLYGLFISEERIYMYMFGGIVAFNMGYIIWSLFRRRYRLRLKSSNSNYNSINKFVFEPRYNFLYGLALICIIYYMGSAVDSIIYLLAGNSMGEIRQMVQASDGVHASSLISKLFNAINVLIIVPGSAVIQVVGAIDFWIGKRNKILFSMGALLAVISAIGEGGRTSIVNFFLYMIIGYVLSGAYLKQKGNLSKKTNRKRRNIIVFFSIIGILFIGWFSISRTGQTLYKNLYLYFSMEPYMFNLWANKVDSAEIYGYSTASLNGFSFMLLYIVKNIFGVDFPNHWKMVYDMIRATDSEWQSITNISTQANAYVTTFWFFYLDGRFSGILGGMLAYGMYVAHTFIEAIRYPNAKTICVFAFILQGLLYVFIRFPFSNIYYAISYLMILFIAYKKKVLK